MNVVGGLLLFNLIAAAAALLFGVLAIAHTPRKVGAAKPPPLHLWVASQALLGMAFVGQLARLAFRQQTEKLDAVLAVSLLLPLSPFSPVMCCITGDSIAKQSVNVRHSQEGFIESALKSLVFRNCRGVLDWSFQASPRICHEDSYESQAA